MHATHAALLKLVDMAHEPLRARLRELAYSKEGVPESLGHDEMPSDLEAAVRAEVGETGQTPPAVETGQHEGPEAKNAMVNGAPKPTPPGMEAEKHGGGGPRPTPPGMEAEKHSPEGADVYSRRKSNLKKIRF